MRWLAAVALVVGGAVTATLLAARLLVVHDPLPVRADAIVILAGSVADRVLAAADLYHAGRASHVLITRERLRRGHAALRARGVHLPEGDELTRRALAQLGVHDDAIVTLRRRTASTEDEARLLARQACRHRMRSLIVVTSRAHSRRARLMLRQALRPAVEVAVYPSPYDFFPTARWWRLRTAAKTVLSEYQKLANYWLNRRWRRVRPCARVAQRARAAP